jgi:hypothetical protein
MPEQYWDGEKTAWRTADGGIHDSEESAKTREQFNEDVMKPMISSGGGNPAGGGLMAIICVVGPFIYIPQFLVKAFTDYGVTTSFGPMFLLGGLPLLALVAWAIFRFFKQGKKLMLILLAICLIPFGFLGFFNLLIGVDYLYPSFYNAHVAKFTDGRDIHVTGDKAALHEDNSADSEVISDLRKGASMMLVGANDSGQLLVRYHKDGGTFVWGWIDAGKTSYKKGDFTKLEPVTITSETLNLRLHQKPESREISALDSERLKGIKAVVIGKSKNPFVGTKGKTGCVPIYAWNNEKGYRYVGYAPTGSLSR